VAIIDIGSNSIKVLVAARDESGNITPLRIQAIDARISAGISQNAPLLTEEGMARGLEAIQALLVTTAAFKPAEVVLVATSAVRDAANGRDFCERVQRATGLVVRILSGEEEANLIGRGLTTDPALRSLQDFYVFDLGGGSLECLAFGHRKIEQAVSLRLGCVRLMEKFVVDPAAPLNPAIAQQIAAHSRDALAQSAFTFTLPAGSNAVGTGGTLTTVRAIFGAREMKAFEETDPVIKISELRQLLDVLGEMPLARRKQISGLPRARADVFPVALATLIALAETGGFPAYHHSVYNLRYGVAAELLARDADHY
jgi:exopolyphosphatase/guanosine-5'-triphosphate,3'-diphosphate pyrophosphatase